MNIKGISKRKDSGNYEAYVIVRNSGKRSKTTFKAHIGTYKTVEEAISARKTFIKNLI